MMRVSRGCGSHALRKTRRVMLKWLFIGAVNYSSFSVPIHLPRGSAGYSVRLLIGRSRVQSSPRQLVVFGGINNV